MSYLNTAFLSNLSGWELVLIFAVILLFFGAKRLPELSESLGKSLRRFKKATSEVEDELRSALDSENSKTENPAPYDSTESNSCSIEHNQDESTKA
tara:strand:+ start:1362 stop:1649 length:288 start_codon:yes stop_codon:yes gene_type:complete